ncbi:MAG: hypothetical protein HZC28_08535 [Spirochaetes bacterium]|nr:hypothetical protein [Spirochaetota bacterium]
MTNCLIDFVCISTREEKSGKSTQHSERRRIYRHSDGYPDTEYGVIAALKSFLRWNRGYNDDLDSKAANFIFWSKLNMLGLVDTPIALSSFGGVEKIGFGICDANEFTYRTGYFYEVMRVKETKDIIRVFEIPKYNEVIFDTLKPISVIEINE